MDSIYISTNIMGGIGNQLFQISHALSQGWKNDVPVILPKALNISRPIWENKLYINNIYKKISHLFVDDIIKGYEVKEENWNKFILNKPIKFVGYFQSSKYFLGYDDKIRNTFYPSEEFIFEMFQKYSQLRDGNTLSLHVRRTDYLNINTHLPTIDKSYFDEAIKQNEEYSTLFIFTDDKKWVKDNFKYNNMIIINEDETYKELWLMSLCNNNIISNSSFSWWGSWLNKNKNKKIYAPSIWLGPKTGDLYEKIYEPNWTKIKMLYKDGKLYKA